MKIKLSILNEQIVLGSMLSSRDLRKKYIKILTPKDFVAPRHQAIFAALMAMEDHKLDYVPSTLKGFLPQKEEEWGGTEYLKKLEQFSAEENFNYHFERIKWDKARVEILGTHVEEFEKLLKDPNLDPDTALMYLRKIEATLQDAKRRNFIVGGIAASATYQADLYGREGRITSRSTGFASLDRKLSAPFAPKQITVIAASPSIGKTTFALNCAYRQAKHWRVGYLAWESGHIAATDIICASALEIPLAKIVKSPGALSSEERNRLDKFLDTMFSSKSNLSFLKPPPAKVMSSQKGPWEVNDKVIDWVESQIVQWGVEIVYWDLFLKKLPDRRPDAVSWALDRIQSIADKHNVHFALLHQITLKQAEIKEDKRPSRAVLKGTGAWIEVPDTVLGLYRKAIYERNVEDTEIEIMCLKQRFGQWPWTVVMDWDGQSTRVTGGREITGTFHATDEDAI